MERAGIVQPETYELIEGELLLKVPKHSPHGRAIAYLSAALRHEFGVDYVLSETTIDLRPEDSPTSEPEPDVILVNIPLGELPKRLAELDKNADLVMHCKMGGRSAKACDLLRQNGFTRVRNMTGGILAWSDKVDPSVPKY